MHDLLVHAGECLTLCPASIGIENAADSAHVYTPIRLGLSSASRSSTGSNVVSIRTR
jgi:hypothetical protein